MARGAAIAVGVLSVASEPRLPADERWRAGYHDTVQALHHPGVLERAAGQDAGIFIFDV